MSPPDKLPALTPQRRSEIIDALRRGTVPRRGLEAFVYFGDEPTDETVFGLKTIQVLGIKVGEGATAASYRVPDVTSVRRWLLELSRN